jgi:phosphoribosylaminoimidazolecarboxamide formyltransferase / IMP cyclohydrolase
VTKVAIARALISVYDKIGVEDLARVLHQAGVEIVSTGSTAAVIAAAGVPVTTVEEITGFPECLDGRVKTLHPNVHAGLLADPGQPEHRAQLDELQIAPFQLLVSNLYPFERTVASGAAAADCVEQIDIGGPAMVRAAAKNHAAVAVVTDPSMYPEVTEAVADGGFTLEQRRRLAARAYAHTAAYDAVVASWFASAYAPDETARDTGLPDVIGGLWNRIEVLRYGENPHQRAALYLPGAAGGGGGEPGRGEPGEGEHGEGEHGEGEHGEGEHGEGEHGEGEHGGIAGAEQLHGKEMSYNNYVDADAARRAAYDFARPCVAITKHSNPCGIAIGTDLADAHRKAHACDPASAYGGVIAANGVVTEALAAQIAEILTDVLVAPGFDPGALDILTRRKNLRVLRCPPPDQDAHTEWRRISGGMLVQSADRVSEPGDEPSGWRLVAGPAADEAALRDLAFAWRACRSVKSNAILLASGEASVGIGMGQVNRVDSVRLAVRRAGDRARGAVAASDAYFPFADNLEELAGAGVQAVAEPGGSIRDQEVIAAAQQAGISLYFTGVRHFYH